MPGSLVIAHDPWVVYDLFKFRRLRLNIIGFLRLPFDITEPALLENMRASSSSLIAHYLSRAECARRSWESKPARPGFPVQEARTDLPAQQARTVRRDPKPASGIVSSTSRTSGASSSAEVFQDRKAGGL